MENSVLGAMVLESGNILCCSREMRRTIDWRCVVLRDCSKTDTMFAMDTAWDRLTGVGAVRRQSRCSHCHYRSCSRRLKLLHRTQVSSSPSSDMSAASLMSVWASSVSQPINNVKCIRETVPFPLIFPPHAPRPGHHCNSVIVSFIRSIILSEHI